MKKGKLFLHAIKAYGGMEVRLHVSLTSALDGDEWLSSYFWSIYPPRKDPWYASSRRPGGPQN